ncbi:SLC13 family permease [Roseospirillum parvum]|uniref:Di-and tricarboxylate transporter n=1 Tax=Roseospirillum parvum TaxID=83401 RepID=A0A1G7WKS2_9PROT|nr:SLC13 family permease [Roseospirillum parvum]SDG72532.1 Di-and tricarboxylate transporter [Roseospirillum parvum]
MSESPSLGARLVGGSGGLVALALLLAPTLGLAGEHPQWFLAGGLTVFALSFWASGLLPEPVTALAFFLLAVLSGVAPPEVIFSGFHSKAVWLVFGGLVIGVAVRKSGLAERLARALTRRLSGSYLSIISAIVAGGFLLAFLMPSSMGRVVLMMPIMLALADALGYPERSRGRAGIVLATGMVAFGPPTAILPAVVPNLVMAGAAESALGVHLAYLEFLGWHLPTTGILKALLLIGAVWLLFRQPPTAPASRPTADSAPPPMSATEKRLAGLLAVTLALWCTDTLHGLSPAWVALGAALVCLLPPLGRWWPESLVGLDDMASKVNYPSLIYLAGMLGMGAVIAASGLGGFLAQRMMELTPFADGGTPADTLWNLGWVAGLTTVAGMAATTPGVPALMTPFAATLAEGTGLSQMSVLMALVTGYATTILPYQVPPLVVAMQMGRVGLASGARLCLLLAGATLLLVWPLTALWWVLGGFVQTP